MSNTKKPLHVLVIEDNIGDYILIKDLLEEKAANSILDHADTFKNAKTALNRNALYDVILLDLNLPDHNGIELVTDVVELAGSIPVIVLSGLSDENFGMQTLSMGISDYLIKDDITGPRLFKSITFAIERNRIYVALESSEEKYRSFFYLSPQPMWVYDVASYSILDVNEAAIRQYGYSRDEFMKKTILDIRPPEDVPAFLDAIEQKGISTFFHRQYSVHVKKNGEIINVEIQSNQIDFLGKKARLVLATDVTQRMKAEELLKESEQRFRVLVQDGSDLIGILDPLGNYKYVSPTADIIGYPSNYLIGKNVADFIHKDDYTEVIKIFNNLFPGERIQIPSFRFKYADGSWHWIETIATNMLEVPTVNGIVVNSRDITEWIEIEQKIKESNERYASVAQATSDAIWDYDIRQNKFFISGTGYKTLFGHELVGEYVDIDFFNQHIHPDDRDRVNAMFMDARATPLVKQSSIEYRFLKPDQTFAHMLSRFSVLFEDEKPVRLLGAIQDITERKMLDQQITKAIIKAQEQERSQIGLELHDNVNQILVGSLLALGMTKEAPENSPNWVEKARGYINEAIGEARKLSHQLAPASFDKESLQQVFETLITNMNVNKKLNIQLNFRYFDQTRVSDDLQLNLYRILQEQLNNIIKYARASVVEISVSNTMQNLSMRIADDGQGFEKSLIRSGIGFSNMKKRAELFLGEFILNTTPGQGCEILINIPLNTCEPVLQHPSFQ